MSKSNVLSNPIFHDADKAREWLETQLWPDGPICPHCGVFGEATLMQGKTTRPGLYQCNACREPFTVTVGTLYERSKVPLNKWLAATHLLMASKKGMSALEVGRLLGLSKKTAWFVCHRIRESLRPFKTPPMGGVPPAFALTNVERCVRSRIDQFIDVKHDSTYEKRPRRVSEQAQITILPQTMLVAFRLVKGPSRNRKA